MTRPLNKIALDIHADWIVAQGKRGMAALPYLKAMMALDTLDDKYGLDSARSIVLYFLANAGTWRGETARTIKAELNKMLADHDKKR